ncbi:hypothetical protein IE077_002145 [Cardiosporidium cionae]|uniref:Uncharacterized protein n=1 Tax=Cardiosporidium cionae TaxID=476202 RepID=A0ABQ7JBJ2_9APIC|nr:hypothetical protein IE077_002145 [Cardiosporidium cionae]|eukprot:KAF8821328.1 hypothetical protein IE077_002145 [Cardiosporidium cionae]
MSQGEHRYAMPHYKHGNVNMVTTKLSSASPRSRTTPQKRVPEGASSQGREDFPQREHLQKFAKTFSIELENNLPLLLESMNRITTRGAYPVNTKSLCQAEPFFGGDLRGCYSPLSTQNMSRCFPQLSPVKNSPHFRMRYNMDGTALMRQKRPLDEENIEQNVPNYPRKKLITKISTHPAEKSETNEDFLTKCFNVARPVLPSRSDAKQKIATSNSNTVNTIGIEETSGVSFIDQTEDYADLPSPGTNWTSADPFNPKHPVSPHCDYLYDRVKQHPKDTNYFHRILRPILPRIPKENFDIGSLLVLRKGGPLNPNTRPLLQDRDLTFIPRDWSTVISVKSRFNEIKEYFRWMEAYANTIRKGAWYSEMLTSDSVVTTLQEQESWNPFSVFGSAPKAVNLNEIFDFSAYNRWATSDARWHSKTLRQLYEEKLIQKPTDPISENDWKIVHKALKKKWFEECKLELDWRMDPLKLDESLWYIDYCGLVVDKADIVSEEQVCFCPTPNPRSHFGWMDPRSATTKYYNGRRASGGYITSPLPLLQQQLHSPNLSIDRVCKGKLMSLNKPPVLSFNMIHSQWLSISPSLPSKMTAQAILSNA